MQRILGVITAAALIVGASQAASANLITNGSFESGIDPGSYTTVYAGDYTSITGWTVTQGNIDYIGSYWNASDGNRSLDLSGYYSAGGISQSFSTTAGQQYLVTFDIAGNTDGNPTIKDLEATVAGYSGTFYFDTTGKSRPIDMGWKTESFTFTATGASSTLTFSTTLDSAFGSTLDNVHVNAAAVSQHVDASSVPEPGSLTILGVVLASICVFGWMKKQKTPPGVAPPCRI